LQLADIQGGQSTICPYFFPPGAANRRKIRMAHILHISCDYIDEIDDRKTPAVFNLINNSSGFRHTVFSLNRTVRPAVANRLRQQDNLYSIYYFGLPFGLGLRFFLRGTANRLLRIVQENGIQPDLVHCHKLTIEGLIGYYICRKLDLPLVCSFRGDTDFKLIRFKPGYRGLYRRILRYSAGVFHIAPWARTKLEHMWPNDLPRETVVLPNIVELLFDRSGAESLLTHKLVSICHLKDYKRKNLIRLIDATDACITEGLGISLDIIGDGPEEIFLLLRDHIRKLRNASRFELLGPRTRVEIEASLGGYAALVLASYPETFGMVYLEALQAGIPILHSKNAGVDGYFAGKGVSIAVDPSSVSSIKSGISAVVERQPELKENVRLLAESGYMEMFNTENVVRVYETTVAGVIENRLAVRGL
jgi:glycosyltransferase involved in cell wall biosynthesis